jgi:HSP20 family protein
MAKKTQKKAAPMKTTASRAVAAPVEPQLPSTGWERAIDRFFDRMFDDFWRLPSLFGPESRWPARELRLRVPPVDVYEEGDHVVVKTELPGLSKDDIELTLTPDTLTIKGEKKKEEKVEEKDYHRWERSYGSFMRTVALPVEVKSEAADAQFKDGVLTVRLPKSPQAKRRTVEIKAQ